MRMSKVALLHAVGAMAVAVTKNSTPDGHVEWVEPNGWADPVESFSFAGFTPSKVVDILPDLKDGDSYC